MACERCPPENYGFPGDVTPQWPQNRFKPIWQGCGPLQGLFGSQMGRLRAGEYKGSIGHVYSNQAYGDMQRVQMMGLAGLGFSGTQGLGSAASDRCDAAQAAWLGMKITCSLISNTADRARCTRTNDAAFYALCPSRDPLRVTPAPQPPASPPVMQTPQATPPPAAAPDRTWMYVGAGAGLLLLGGMGFLLLRKRR